MPLKWQFLKKETISAFFVHKRKLGQMSHCAVCYTFLIRDRRLSMGFYFSLKGKFQDTSVSRNHYLAVTAAVIYPFGQGKRHLTPFLRAVLTYLEKWVMIISEQLQSNLFTTYYLLSLLSYTNNINMNHKLYEF